MPLSPADLLTEPLDTIHARANALSAARSWSALEGTAGQAMMAHQTQLQDTTQNTLKEMEAMGFDTRALKRDLSPGPLARLFDRLRDLIDDWRDRRAPDPNPIVAAGALLTAPIPLAQTRPYQDVPADYDEIDNTMERLITECATLISAHPHWQERPLPDPALPDDAFDAEDWDDATDFAYQLSQTRHLWQDSDTGALLFLQHVEEPDPKIMGTQLALGFLENPDAATLLAHLSSL